MAILKGKPLLGMIGIFTSLVSLVGAVRLASPSSVWARRRYDPGGRKLARAQARWQRIEARRRRVTDAIAGAPEAPRRPGRRLLPRPSRQSAEARLRVRA